MADGLSPGGEDAPHRGSADSQPSRNLRVTHLLGLEAENIVDLQRCRSRPTVRAALLPSLGNAGADPLAQDLTLELGEDREHARHRAASGRGQIESFGQ
jgi:hypothetical protein